MFTWYVYLICLLDMFTWYVYLRYLLEIFTWDIYLRYLLEIFTWDIYLRYLLEIVTRKYIKYQVASLHVAITFDIEHYKGVYVLTIDDASAPYGRSHEPSADVRVYDGWHATFARRWIGHSQLHQPGRWTMSVIDMLIIDEFLASATDISTVVCNHK